MAILLNWLILPIGGASIGGGSAINGATPSSFPWNVTTDYKIITRMVWILPSLHSVFCSVSIEDHQGQGSYQAEQNNKCPPIVLSCSSRLRRPQRIWKGFFKRHSLLTIKNRSYKFKTKIIRLQVINFKCIFCSFLLLNLKKKSVFYF